MNDMKEPGLKWLSEKAMESKRRLYPSVPDHCRPVIKYTDTNTNGLTKAVIDTFILSGMFASRIDSKGTYSQALKRFIPSNQKRGLPDVFAQAAGLPPLWIEIKCAATKDRLKPHQVEVIEQLRKSGAIVFIATEYQSFYEWFNNEVINKQTVTV
jgi:hypothetical protein